MMGLLTLKRALGLLALLAALALPFLSDFDRFILLFSGGVLISIIYASSWNLLAFSGQGSLGHAAFFGIGAYTSAILTARWEASPFITMFFGGALAALAGLFVGLLCVRLREWFLAMVTFGVPVILTSLTVTHISPIPGTGPVRDLLNAVLGRVSSVQSILGGHDGLFPRAVFSRDFAKEVAASYNSMTGASLSYKVAASAAEYYVLLALTLAIILVIHIILKTKPGFALAAIRENQLEARSLGVNTTKYKLLAFVMSTFIAGMAGALNAHHIRYVNPAVYSIDNSFNPVIYCIVGGLGTLEGPIIGTVGISVLNEVLKGWGLTYLKNVIIGTIIVVTVLFAPQGLGAFLKAEKWSGIWKRARGWGRTG
jgi:branched-chain amino acid transport system permease protein